MRIYIDESGDPGIKLQKQGTSPHFVVAGVLINSDSDHDRCVSGLHEFQTTGNYQRSEFKFSHCDNELRTLYLRAAARLPWRYLAIVLNKARLSSPGFKYKETTYKYTVRLLLSNAQPYLDGATLVFDRCGSRDFRRTLDPYIREQTTRTDGSDPIKRILAQTSHSDPLLQLADMVAGAVSRSYKVDKENSAAFRSTIKSKEIGVQLWPK